MRPIDRDGVGCLLLVGLVYAVALVGTAGTRMRTLPPSPLEGTWSRACRGHELWAIRQLERPGYDPRPPQIVATTLPTGEARARRAQGTLTSAALNESLAGGGNRHFVETSEGVADIRLVPRRDVTR